MILQEGYRTEMRTIVEGKTYLLWMNPISGKCEDVAPVVAFSDYQ